MEIPAGSGVQQRVVCVDDALLVGGGQAGQTGGRGNSTGQPSATGAA